jgi:hypothetical protein
MPTRDRLRSVLARLFGALGAIATANTAAIVGMRWAGLDHPSWPIAGAAAALAVTAFGCAAAFRRGEAREIRRTLAAWALAGVAAPVVVGLTYEPGARFWWFTGAALLSWGATGALVARLWRRSTPAPASLAAPIPAPALAEGEPPLAPIEVRTDESVGSRL